MLARTPTWSRGGHQVRWLADHAHLGLAKKLLSEHGILQQRRGLVDHQDDRLARGAPERDCSLGQRLLDSLPRVVVCSGKTERRRAAALSDEGACCNLRKSPEGEGGVERRLGAAALITAAQSGKPFVASANRNRKAMEGCCTVFSPSPRSLKLRASASILAKLDRVSFGSFVVLMTTRTTPCAFASRRRGGTAFSVHHS